MRRNCLDALGSMARQILSASHQFAFVSLTTRTDAFRVYFGTTTCLDRYMRVRL